MDYIKEIAEAMSANHAAVMIGAGFSKNADKISSTDKWFKNWNELSDMFYETVYGNAGPGKEYNSSLRLAQEVEITVGRPKLENILKEAVPDEDYGPSEVYTKLMELPWRDVFTTNYDTLLERAADKVSKRRYNVVVNQEDLVNSNDAPRILKLHGSFPSQRPFIITEEDYRTYPIKFAAMVNTVQQALLENVFCMIGFSCEDPNFLNSKIYYALDYLRFLEQTGHPFRIQMVTNTKGFQRVIETLYLYYPQWCLIQILIAQNEKELDMLFGRNKLSGMTQEEVDNCIQEYIKALDLVSKNIKPENANWSTSVYDNSAKILPQIISRLCYKCSIEILDQILDYMLILCSSNVRDNFKGINKILEGVCNAYTEKEQGERIEKILRFPMKTNERRTYYDPVNYLKRPKEKYKINDDLYNNIIIQIRQLMEIGTAQEKADALQRLIILAQLIYLKQNDEEYLYQCLEKKQTCEHQNILYHLNKERYKLNDDLILKSTLQLMEQDSNKQYFSSHTGSYRELIDILPDVQSDAIDYKKIFSVMTKLIKTNIDRKNDQQTAFQIEERSKQSYRIAVGLLLLKIKKKEIISIEEKEVIEEYFKTLQEYYNASNVLEFIEKLLLEKLNISEDIYTNMEEKLWLHSEEDINLLQIFYLETSRIKIDIKQMKRFGTFSNMVYQMAIYRIINTEISNVMPVLRLLYALVVNNIIVERETKLLFINLPRLMKDTTIGVEDFEKEARHKLNCRREICVIVSEYYKKGERNNNVLEWMELTKNSNEFVEIRNIEFE